MTPEQSALVARLTDRDAIAEAGLFHAVPAMREAAASIRELVGEVKRLENRVRAAGLPCDAWDSRCVQYGMQRDAAQAERDALRAEVERLEREVEHLYTSKQAGIEAAVFDAVNGTPCEQIRWQQERDKLHQQLKQARRYMGHDAHCSDRQPKGICCCGFKDFLAGLPS